MRRRTFVGTFLAAAALVWLAPASPVWAEPGRWSPTCRQGETFVRVITWCTGPTTAACVAGTGVYVNLTGFSGKLQLRDIVTGAVIDEFTETTGLALGGVAGTVTWTVTATETALLTVGAVAYDLRLTSGTGVVTYLLAGHLNVQARVTQ
jgi:hypothetical protein